MAAHSKQTERIPTGWAIVIPFFNRAAAEDTARILLNGQHLLYPGATHLRPIHGPDGFGERVEIDAKARP